MTRAFLALGSNLANPVFQIKTALNELLNLPQTTLLNASSLYKNPPVGFEDQPDFINAVVEINTDLSPFDLLNKLLAIEAQHRRIRTIKNGPRTLDIDILLYGNEIINTSALQLPHPRMKERIFVTIPLAEIAPQLILPCGTPLVSLLGTTEKSYLEIIESGYEC